MDLQSRRLERPVLLRANSIQKKGVQFKPNSQYEEERKKEKLSECAFFPSYTLVFVFA